MARRDELHKLITVHQRRLQKLKEQAALYGISADPHIPLEIEDIEAMLEELQAELATLEEVEGAPSQPTPAGQPASAGPSVSEDRPVAPEPPQPVSEAIASGSSPAISSPEIASLREALERRSLVLFTGPDLPPEVTGLPARADLARELARRTGLDESLSLAEVAQRVSQAGNRFEFTDFIRNALDTAGKSPQPFHRRMATLVKDHQIETIITIAYDNLLELAFQQAGLGVNRVIRGSDVNFINPDRPSLIKLYGDVQQPDTLVVTDQDHSNLLRDRDREAIIDEVRRAFRRNTVLFLGYNLADPDFRFLFDQVAGSRFARTAYAVWPGLPEADARMWRDRGIVILGTDPLGIFGTVAVL